MKRIGFYGGSFNPPHAGHQATILHAWATAKLDELLVAPVYKHPYGKELLDFQKRIDMCNLLVKRFGAEVQVSTIERSVWDGGGEGLTCNTIFTLIKDYYGVVGERPHIVLIMGSDIKNDLPKWKGYDQLIELCTRGWLSFFFVERISGLSSTAVRDAIKNGGFVDRWLPQEIHEYIFKNQLYR